jgi:TorA maturation chaperone TorD
MEPQSVSISGDTTNNLPHQEVESEFSADNMRTNMYRLLAALMAAPASNDLLQLLKNIDLDDTGISDDSMATAWKTIRLACEHASLDSIDDEFHDLFIGISSGEIVPYGSWYQTGFMMDRPLALLRQDLVELGIVRDEGVREPEDHVSALCETMSLLAEEGGGVSIEAQRKFFDNHMKAWIQRFFQDMQNARSAHFYAAVGQLGEKFFDIEKRYLELPV